MKKSALPLIFNLLIFFFFFFFISNAFVSVNSQSDSCNSTTPFNFNDLVNFDTTVLSCQSVWQDRGFVLRYEKVNSKTWSYILSAPNKYGYVAIGFSSDGNMVGSSAMVGWQENGSTGKIMQYYLGDRTSYGVKPDEGNLTVVKNSTTVFIQSSTIYLAFQLTSSQPSDYLIFAVGWTTAQPKSPKYQLQPHWYRTSTQLNYASGQVATLKSPYTSLRRGHGVVNIMTWGTLVPIGALTARYFRRWDPIWFYSHVAIQTIGFILGLIGIILGFVLEGLLNADDTITHHKNIGVFILVLGCLQVTALLARPKRDSKNRKYWNWYHHYAGRLLILLAVVNIFYGIRLAEEGVSWSLSYGVILAIMVITSIFWEIRLRRED